MDGTISDRLDEHVQAIQDLEARRNSAALNRKHSYWRDRTAAERLPPQMSVRALYTRCGGRDLPYFTARIGVRKRRAYVTRASYRGYSGWTAQVPREEYPGQMLDNPIRPSLRDLWFHMWRLCTEDQARFFLPTGHEIRILVPDGAFDWEQVVALPDADCMWGIDGGPTFRIGAPALLEDMEVILRAALPA